MAMFDNVGPTLSLLRSLRGKSQADMADNAGIGKSQLSKYENSHELPKLDSLEKVLTVLGVPYLEFFYALNLMDRLAEGAAGEPAGVADAGAAQTLSGPSVLQETSLLPEPTHQAFSQLFADLLRLHRRMIEQTVVAGASRQASRRKSRTRKRRSSQRAAASSPPRSASPR
jgi:transcriptional regulator with XRE-family HTH domain